MNILVFLQFLTPTVRDTLLPGCLIHEKYAHCINHSFAPNNLTILLLIHEEYCWIFYALLASFSVILLDILQLNIYLLWIGINIKINITVHSKYCYCYMYVTVSSKLNNSYAPCAVLAPHLDLNSDL